MSAAGFAEVLQGVDGEVVYVRTDLADSAEAAAVFLHAYAQREWGAPGDGYVFTRRVWMRSAPNHPEGPGWMVPTKRKWGECEYWEFVL